MTPTTATGAPDDSIAIAATAVQHRYGSHVAVHSFDLAVARGEIVAVLGPNGAGKTTAIEILEGYRRPTSGRVRVLGADPFGAPRTLRHRIGIVLQEAGFVPEITVAETVQAWRRLYPGAARVAEALERVDLGARSATLVKNLSGGERRRLDLALGTIGDPEVLFLDEPTTGLDPEARRLAWSLVERCGARGAAVVLTSHNLEEVDALAQRVVVLAAGRVIATGTPDELRERAGDTVVRFGLPDHIGLGDLPSVGPHRYERRGASVELRTSSPTMAAYALGRWAVERGIELDDLTMTRPSLEDAYFDLVEVAS